MRSLWAACLYLVCKLRHACVWMGALSPHSNFVRKGLLLSTGLYTQLVPYFAAYFSTLFCSILSPLLPYFYPASTRPTSTTTSLLNFKSLVTVEETNI
jgi:hypothetical protein